MPGDGIAALITRGQARRFLGALWAANAFFFIYNLLLAAGWKGGMNTFAKQLNLDNEACVASWYQSMLLFLLALAATGQWLTRLNAGRGSDRREQRQILALGLVAFFMSADEVSMFHESVEGIVLHHLKLTLWGMTINWAILLSPFLLALGVFLLAFWLGPAARAAGARLLGLAGLACWAGAIMLELLEKEVFPKLHGVATLIRLECPFEETLEIAGATLLLTAVIRLWLAQTKALHAADPSRQQGAATAAP